MTQEGWGGDTWKNPKSNRGLGGKSLKDRESNTGEGQIGKQVPPGRKREL